ncbi:hypothetical protein [Oceanobacillus profundus]|uniref:hypothetical protein n=1 Tax=Oceanobacillus profundus TaxID=372463 RepID=UPI00363FB2C5
MEYRGIKIDDCVKWRNADGSISQKIKTSIDKLADSLVSRGHKLLDTYKGNRTEVLIDFGCGHKPRMVVLKDYKRENGVGCDRCSGHSPEQAREDFFIALEENGHELLSEYVDNLHKVLIDFKCGHKPRMVVPKDYKKENGVRCNRCSRHSPEQAKEDFFIALEGNGHELLSMYIDNKFKVLIDFKCGHHPSMTTPKDYKNEHRCRRCQYENSEWNKIQKENALKSLMEIVKRNEHELLSKYIGIKTMILIDFKCGHEPSWIMPSHYRNGQECQQCSRNDSKGEVRIKYFLEKNKLNFKGQFTFKDLVYIQKLRFDFAVIKDRKPQILIEYDGEQHFIATEFMGGEKKLRENQIRDKMKNGYCVKNNIRLIRIKYTDFNNIESILEKELLNGETISRRGVISFYPKVGYYDNSFEEQLSL